MIISGQRHGQRMTEWRLPRKPNPALTGGRKIFSFCPQRPCALPRAPLGARRSHLRSALIGPWVVSISTWARLETRSWFGASSAAPQEARSWHPSSPRASSGARLPRCTAQPRPCRGVVLISPTAAGTLLRYNSTRAAAAWLSGQNSIARAGASGPINSSRARSSALLRLTAATCAACR